MKLKIILLIICSALLLQGCIASIVAIGSAAIATKAATDPRSIGTQIDDATLEARIKKALNKDLQLKKHVRIIATAYHGKVLLTGQSPSFEITNRAKQIAMETKGTKEVYNEIRHRQAVSLSTTSSDAWITAKVRSQLFTSGIVKSSVLKVSTENSEVFLMGLVTEKEGRAAAKIASQISGVKYVTTAFSLVK